MTHWLYLALAIGLEVTASLCLKGALDATWLYVPVAAGYLGSFSALSMSLRHGMNLGVAYGIWGASGVALTAIMSLIIFDEPLTLLMGIGIAVIMVGVLLVELGSQAARKNAQATL
ncbi:DMT family transporter [Demequina sp.]|uniref:DMT family transporter n=1 Tax=Demequina sp. TaxID=2050685 RepID=UPI003A839043